MAQKIRDGLQNVKGPFFCVLLLKRIFVLLLLLVRVTKGDDDPKERRKRKRRRRRRAFLRRRRPHRESAKRFDVVSLFLCVRSRLRFFVSKHHHLFNRETTYKSARGKRRPPKPTQRPLCVTNERTNETKSNNNNKNAQGKETHRDRGETKSPLRGREEAPRRERKERKKKKNEKNEKRERSDGSNVWNERKKKAREKVERDMKNNPHANTPATAEARRAQAEARMREKKKMKEAEEQAKRELDVLMGVVSDVSITKRPTKEETEEERASEDARDGGGGGRETTENRGEEKRAERTGEKTSRDATTGTDGPRCKVETRGGRVRPVRGLSGRDAFRRRLPRGRERENVFKRLMKAACGLTKKGEVRNAVGGLQATSRGHPATTK